MAILREDVHWAYRILLGREPGSEEEIATILEYGSGFSRRGLAETFLLHGLSERAGYIVDLLNVKGDPRTPAVLISLGAGPRSAADLAPPNGDVANGRRSASMFRGWWSRAPQSPDEQPVGRDDVLWAT